MMARALGGGRSVSLACISSRKRELVGEFLVDRRIGNVAAGRHIEIMQRDRILQPGALTEHDRDVAAIALAAKVADRGRLERQPREHDDAVVAFLAVERDVFVAEPLEPLARKSVVRTLGLLQAENIGLTALRNLATRSMRKRTELMFQVVTVICMRA